MVCESSRPLGGPIDQCHRQLAMIDFDRFVLRVGIGQSCSGGRNAGPADLDGVGIKLPRVITVNELELCACHGYHFDDGV